MAGKFDDLLGTLRSIFRIGRVTLSASAATAARTATLPDKSGTLAMLDDVGSGGGASFRVVTAVETLAPNDYLVADLAANGTFPMPTTITAGESFALRNSPDSAAGVVVSLNPGAARSIIYGDGQSTPVGDTITLSRGETIKLVALDNTKLELVVQGAVGLTGPAGIATPGGSNRQLQFNNAGALGGSSNVRLATTNDNLELGTFADHAAIATPAAPASGFLRTFARTRAGRALLAMVGPSGISTALQPALFGNTAIMWSPSTGTTVSGNFGTSWTARNAGTGAAQAHPTRASTNALTSMMRATFGTGTTAVGSSGIQSANTVFWRGNAAGLGGGFFAWRLGVETNEAAMRYMLGLSALNAALNGEPSVQNNSILLCKDSTDANWQIATRDGATTNKINTTVAVATGVPLDFFIFAPPNASFVAVALVNAVTGDVLYENTNVTANLPVNTTFLFAHAQCQSTVGTTAKLLALNKIYGDTDL